MRPVRTCKVGDAEVLIMQGWRNVRLTFEEAEQVRDDLDAILNGDPDEEGETT